MGKGGNTNTVTESADPWGPQQQYLQYGFNQARDIYQNQRPQFAPFPTYTPMSAGNQAGIEMLQQRSLAGSPVQDASQGWATNTLQGGAMNPYGMGGLDQGFGAMGMGMGGGMSLPGAAGYFANTPDRDMLRSTAEGDYLNANPYLDQTYARGMENIGSNLNATFGSGGRTGSGIHALAMGKAGADLANQIYGGNYQQERSRMQGAQNALTGYGMQGAQAGMGAYQQGLSNLLQGGSQMAGVGSGLYGQDMNQQARAAAMAPTLANMDYTDINAMLQAGAMEQGQAGQVLGDAVSRWNFPQTGAGSPQAALQNYIAAIQGNYGGNVQSKQDAGGVSPLNGILGGGLLGLGASSIPALAGVGAWPLAGIGAGIGLLGSLF